MPRQHRLGDDLVNGSTRCGAGRDPDPDETGLPCNPLSHHGDAETADGLLDFAVNVFAGARPGWLDDALQTAVAHSSHYPDPGPATAAVAQYHGRRLSEVLVTSGAAEAFSLVACGRSWRRPVVVHPQFTEPHAALERAGHVVTSVLCRAEDGFALDPRTVPEDADLVVVGNPTNPTGVLHPVTDIRRLLRRGRVVVVDEAFMDAVPGETESLVRERGDGLVVVRSLTKHWSIPGIRAGYVVGDASVVSDLCAHQVPWSVSSPALAAVVACSGNAAAPESRERADSMTAWRGLLEAGLCSRGIRFVASAAPFLLAQMGDGARAALRHAGVAVRRGDTFPGLDATWVRIAVRPPSMTMRLLAAYDRAVGTTRTSVRADPTAMGEPTCLT